jgi:hypothetical protein
MTKYLKTPFSVIENNFQTSSYREIEYTIDLLIEKGDYSTVAHIFNEYHLYP